MSDQPISQGTPPAKPVPQNAVPSISDAAAGMSRAIVAVNAALRMLGPVSAHFDRTWFETNVLRQLSDTLNIADLLSQQIYDALRQRGAHCGVEVPELRAAIDSLGSGTDDKGE